MPKSESTPNSHSIRPTLYEIKRFFTAFKPPDFNQARRAIDEVFGDEINFLIEGQENYRSLAENIFMLALDPGIRMEKRFGENNAEGHVILNRQSMLHRLRKRSGFRQTDDKTMFHVDKKFNLLKLDIKDFRLADEMGAGDYNLNIFAKALDEALNKIAEKLGGQDRDRIEKIRQENLLLGRYGGDEFIIGIIDDGKGILSKTNEIISIIKQNLETEKFKGFFHSDAIPEKFKIKELEEINIPQDDDKDGRQIFFSFLQRGLVLNAGLLEREKKYFRKSVKNQTLKDYLKEVLARKIYPDEIKILPKDERIKEKISYLVKSHPELKIPFFVAQILDEKSQTQGGNKKMEYVLEFMENYLVDPLLDEVAMTRFDILDHLERGEFKNVYGYELKVKETNEVLSYAYSDQMITKLWLEKFKIEFREEIQQGVVKVGRVGGMIIIGETRGAKQLSKAKRARLMNINNIRVKFEDKEINHEIGFIALSGLPEQMNEKEAKKIFSEIFIQSTKNWLEKTFYRIADKKNEQKAFLEFLKDETNEPESLLTLLSAKYFTSTRWYKRIPVALEVLRSMSSGTTDKFQPLFEELKLLYNRKNKVK